MCVTPKTEIIQNKTIKLIVKMLEDKYKELDDELTSYQVEKNNFHSELENNKKSQAKELLAFKKEIQIGTRCKKVYGKDWRFRIQIFVWKMMLMIIGR